MDSIFHEKQEGQLCAQHCLNNLLQGAYFTAVDLAKFASELDEEEKRITNSASGFKQQSTNMDDSGYFSVQVISKALSVWNLSMVPLSSPEMKLARETPMLYTSFICNHEHHWLTIRKLGKQWFNLNSLQRSPELVSDTYLKMFLAQLQLEGYSIFVVTGSLPPSEADEVLTLLPAVKKASLPSSRTQRQTLKQKQQEEYEFELAATMSASMSTAQQKTTSDKNETASPGSHDGSKLPSVKDLREKRLQYFGGAGT